MKVEICHRTSIPHISNNFDPYVLVIRKFTDLANKRYIICDAGGCYYPIFYACMFAPNS